MGEAEILRPLEVPRPGPRPPGARGPSGPRVVGPGRLERRYQVRIEGLEAALSERERRTAALGRALETSERLERGCQTLLDRMEERQKAERARRRALEQRERRLILLLGALQRDNEHLRERLALARPERARLAGRRAPRGWWARLFGPRSRGA